MKYKRTSQVQTNSRARKKDSFGPPLHPDRSGNLNSKNSEILARLWDDFTHPKKRMLNEGPFLLKHLGACHRIFDGCMGTGVDSLYLLEQGYEVTSNELDRYLLKKALETARRKGVALNITRHDWRELERHIKERSFDAALCLGNALTYLFTKEDQLSALHNFRFILEAGGLFFLDVRNYEYMLQNREAILESKASSSYSGRYVYCGMDRVPAVPVAISDDEIVLEYPHLPTGETGHLVLYPFRLEELSGLLLEAGFTGLRLFSDYREGFDPGADFYQFVCTKP